MPLPDYYRNPLQVASGLLNQPRQGELKPVRSPLYSLGGYLEDRAGMPNTGRVLQRVGTGSYGEIDPAQAVRGATEVAMQVPQFKTTGAAMQTAGMALRPALQAISQQGMKAALPNVAKAIPQVGNAAIEGLSLAGAMTGNEGLTDLASMGRAGTRGLSALTKREIDIGEQGARNLAAARNNPNLLRQLASAKRLYDRGMTNESVFKQTGWRRIPGQEGTEHWAYEISDAAAQLKPNAPAGTLASQLTHPDLMDAYPEVGFIQRNPNMGLPVTERGNFTANKGKFGTIEWNPNLLNDPEAQKRNALHEIQHAIQSYEGWPRGTGPESLDAFKYAFSEIGKMEDSGIQLPTTKEGRNELLDRLKYKYYHYRPGEVQARLASERMNYAPEQRRSIFPEYEVPPEEKRFKTPEIRNFNTSSLLSDPNIYNYFIQRK